MLFAIIILFLDDKNYKFWLHPVTLQCLAAIISLVYVSYSIAAVIDDKDRNRPERKETEKFIKKLRIAIVISFVLIVFITMFTMHDEMEYFLLAQGGNEDLLQIVKLPFKIYFKLDLALLGVALLSYKFVKSTLLRHVLLACMILTWICSGRVVGRLDYGDIVYGWFFIPTGYKKMPDNSITHLPHYFYAVKSNNVTSHIFIGPFIWDASDKFFKWKGYKILR